MESKSITTFHHVVGSAKKTELNPFDSAASGESDDEADEAEKAESNLSSIERVTKEGENVRMVLRSNGKPFPNPDAATDKPKPTFVMLA